MFHHDRRVLAFVLALLFAPAFLFANPGRSAAQVADLKVLLVIDTNASRVGGADAVMRPAMTANLKHIQDVLGEVELANPDKFRGKMSVTVLQGNDVTPENIRRHYQSHRSIYNSGLFFYYSGHGATDPKRGHYLATSGGNIFRGELRGLMNDTAAKSIILASDCCSSFADFTPPPRRKPASWKAFNNLFLENEGFVDFTAATRGEFAWVNSVEGGMFTRAFTNYLCEPPEKIRLNGEPGVVGWDDFFSRVESATNDNFLKAKAMAPEGSEIKTVKRQMPEKFSLGGWGHNQSKQLIVKNNTGEKLCVWVEYLAWNLKDDGWEWYYPTPKGQRFEIDAGQETLLLDGGKSIVAHRAKIWASSLDGKTNWAANKTVPVELVPQGGYVGQMSGSIYTFKK